jgi:hypothetical protein
MTSQWVILLFIIIIELLLSNLFKKLIQKNKLRKTRLLSSKVKLQIAYQITFNLKIDSSYKGVWPCKIKVQNSQGDIQTNFYNKTTIDPKEKPSSIPNHVKNPKKVQKKPNRKRKSD